MYIYFIRIMIGWLLNFFRLIRYAISLNLLIAIHNMALRKNNSPFCERCPADHFCTQLGSATVRDRSYPHIRWVIRKHSATLGITTFWVQLLKLMFAQTRQKKTFYALRKVLKISLSPFKLAHWKNLWPKYNTVKLAIFVLPMIRANIKASYSLYFFDNRRVFELSLNRFIRKSPNSHSVNRLVS